MEKLPTKYKIMDYWHHNLPDWMFIDPGEPDCWACRRHFSSLISFLNKIDVSEKDRYTIDGYIKEVWIKELWNGLELERHHIIPRSLGGGNECDNLFLLCENCHINAPHVKDRDYFFYWAKSWQRAKIEKMVIDVKIVMDYFNVSEEWVKEIRTLIMFAPNVFDCAYRELSGHYHETASAHYCSELFVTTKELINKGWDLDKLKAESKHIMDSVVKNARGK